MGSDLHPAHQQRLESHSLHFDHQLLQGAGGAVTVPLATQVIINEGPQEPNQHHNLHGTLQAGVLPFKRQTVTDVLSRHGCPVWLMEQKSAELITNTQFIFKLKYVHQKAQEGNYGFDVGPIQQQGSRLFCLSQENECRISQSEREKPHT